jgi:uncharacterized protein YdeI (YjbR/CyaY-like superfamily)
MHNKEIKVFYPTSQAAWREWLEINHKKEPAVWLMFYKKSTKKPTLSWSDAVDEALCFGWIDSKKVKIDEETSHQFFSKRNPKSTWSKINKNKVEKLIEQNLMTEDGYKSIETAKQNGSWTILDEVEDLIIPTDLDLAFEQIPNLKETFLNLSKSKKKLHLSILVFAKTSVTRQKRIRAILESLEPKLM